MRHRAFTLIEILIVVAIIAILAAFIFPVLARAKDKANETSDVSNMKQLYAGLTLYEQDYDDRSPNTLDDVKIYVTTAGVYKSPKDPTGPGADGFYHTAFASPPLPGTTYRVSYAYLRNFEPFSLDDRLWSSTRLDSKIGIIACPWYGHRHWLSDYLAKDVGELMDDGPVLRINMDGSSFRLAQRQVKWPIVGADINDLFFNR